MLIEYPSEKKAGFLFSDGYGRDLCLLTFAKSADQGKVRIAPKESPSINNASFRGSPFVIPFALEASRCIFLGIGQQSVNNRSIKPKALHELARTDGMN